MKTTKQKLPKGIKSKWVKALRSGKFKQGDGVLYWGVSNTYCCLGVLGQVCGYSIDKLEIHDFLYSSTFVDIPSVLQNDSPIAKKLARWNDNGKSFQWIAAYIERYL